MNDTYTLSLCITPLPGSAIQRIGLCCVPLSQQILYTVRKLRYRHALSFDQKSDLGPWSTCTCTSEYSGKEQQAWLSDNVKCARSHTENICDWQQVQIQQSLSSVSASGRSEVPQAHVLSLQKFITSISSRQGKVCAAAPGHFH